MGVKKGGVWVLRTAQSSHLSKGHSLHHLVWKNACWTAKTVLLNSVWMGLKMASLEKDSKSGGEGREYEREKEKC